MVFNKSSIRTRKRSVAPWTVGLLLAGELMVCCQAKPIQLRNGAFDPEREAPQARQAIAAEGKPFAALIQFDGPMTAGKRAELAALGVRLVRPVPQDAFVAVVTEGRLDQLNQLPGVLWAGEYEPSYKVDAELSGRMASQDPDAVFRVRALVDPELAGGELAGLRALFRRVNASSRSRFGSILEGAMASGSIASAAQHPSVLWVELAPEPELLDELSSKIVGGDDGVGGTGTLSQQLGYDGQGVTVAVVDTGLENGTLESMHPDLAGRVAGFFSYGNLNDGADRHSHGTHVAGIIAGNAATGQTDSEGYLYGLGVAPGAAILAQKIFDGDGAFMTDPPAWSVITADAVRSGADIGSNSWGDRPTGRPGRYDTLAAEFDALVRDADPETPGDQPFILEFSAGNDGPGPRTMMSPALAKNVIATGASQNNRFDLPPYDAISENLGQEAIASFSSRGPSEDGRIKPDVVAPGTWIASLLSASSFRSGELFAGSGGISERYMYQSGTSHAGPHASGAAAVFVQYYREKTGGATPSPALVKAALINSAVNLDDEYGTAPAPNHDEGWGRVDLPALLNQEAHAVYHDQEEFLENGEVYELRFLAPHGLEELKITLAYTDVPGFPPALPALVNDLDLEVVGPFGDVYFGNQFDQGVSVPDVESRDSINNVEGVHLRNPVAGDYTLRVHARQVIEDALSGTPEVDQDFALAISHSAPFPGQGIVSLDRRAYTAPDQAMIRLVDLNLAGAESVDVQVTASGGGEETVTLAPGEWPGVFVGQVATVTTDDGGAGSIRVVHGGAIIVHYTDEAPAGVRTAEASIDLAPPVITDVETTSAFGAVAVHWTTDELAIGAVEFGQNGNLSNRSAERVLTRDHSITLNGLKEDELYQFRILSTDLAGNETIEDNGGVYFEFTAPKVARVLLVDAFYDDFFFPEPPPLANYTRALEDAGITYEVWPVQTEGSPALSDLTPFRVVIWRLPEISLSQPTLTEADQTALRTYLDSGGALFIASMEVLTRLNEAGSAFGEEVLKVRSYSEDLGVAGLEGIPNDPISHGVFLETDFSDYADFDISDVIVPSTNAAPIFREPVEGLVVGLRSPKDGQGAGGRVVFLPFPLDVIPENGAAPNNRSDILKAIIEFLSPGAEGVGSVTLDRAVYTIPSLVTVEVADSDLEGAEHVEVTVTSESDPDGVILRLEETFRPGLFRGRVALTANISGAETEPELLVQEGDQVRATYWDASRSQNVMAFADLDTEPPVISGIAIEPDYRTAVIRWTTTEPCDSLVPFGQSRLLDRNSYDGALKTEHELLLRGLDPDTLYYFAVVSRDEAGNVTTDDQGRQWHTFRTLVPEQAPWSDEFEEGDGQWSVIEGVQIEPNVFSLSFFPVQWSLGPPRNNRETSAFSPSNAWGSNLNGEASDGADNLLLSPAIQLSGGNRAVLRFRHSYDFTAGVHDELIPETAEVYVIRTTIEDRALIKTITGASNGWKLEEIDLSAYADETVRIGFYYGFLAFDVSTVSGWLIDDVEVDVSQATLGTIEVTSNLSRGTFELTGPASYSGGGWTSSFPTAPAGEYTASFGAVPFYIAPEDQSVTLTAGETATVSGVYTFEDSNLNGLSDEWEEQFFGAVDPDHSSSIDSDGDGASDGTEFLSGTHPLDSASALKVSFTFVNQTMAITWMTEPGFLYRAVGSPDVVNWAPLSEWMTGDGQESSFEFQATESPEFIAVEVAP